MKSDIFLNGQTTGQSLAMHVSPCKESRAPITCSYKKLRAFVHATIDICSLWALYTARSQAIVVRFARNKKR